MTLTLQIVFIIVSVVTFIYAIMKIRKSQLQISDSISWIIGAIFLILISFFTNLVMHVSSLFGFYSASNFILTMFVFFLLLITFKLNIKISILSEKLKNLNHYVALMETKQDDEKKDGFK